MEKEKIKKIVKEGYSNIAKSDECCCSCSCKAKKEMENEIARQIGYSDDEIKLVPGANMGLGCGNPLALAKLKEGDSVLDLGSGAGFDCFIASRKVGKTGRVTGIDMTEEMIEKAKENARKHKIGNVEFVLGDIEELPFPENRFDAIISNCVINLAPDKLKVFKEAYRVLKKGGKMYVSDIVLLKELDEEKKNNPYLLTGCVAGALLKNDYLSLIRKAGFKVSILGEDKEISKKQYNGIPLESLKIEAVKN